MRRTLNFNRVPTEVKPDLIQTRNTKLQTSALGAHQHRACTRAPLGRPQIQHLLHPLPSSTTLVMLPTYLVEIVDMERSEHTNHVPWQSLVVDQGMMSGIPLVLTLGPPCTDMSETFFSRI